KVDRAAPDGLTRLEARLRDLNPAAPILRSANGSIDPARILDIAPHAGAPRALAGWLGSERYVPLGAGALALGAPQRHDARIRSFAVVFDQPVSGTRLWQGLEALIERRGEHLLRIKGIVDVAGQAQPRVIHVVQHLLYPVTILPAWPDE